MSRWTGSVIAPSPRGHEVRGNVSGPLATGGDQCCRRKQQRDGYTRNSVTGNDLDYRDGTFAKAQLLYLPTANWEARLIYAHERDRDGDYALGDLSAIRTAPYRVTRDYEGFTNRDINNTTVNLRARAELRDGRPPSSPEHEDETDLDYSPLHGDSPKSEKHAVHAAGPLSSPDNAPSRRSTMSNCRQGGTQQLRPMR